MTPLEPGYHKADSRLPLPKEGSLGERKIKHDKGNARLPLPEYQETAISEKKFKLLKREDRSVQEKTEALTRLFPLKERKARKLRMQRTVEYINKNRKALVQKVKDLPDQSFHFRPKEHGMKREEMFNLNLSIDKEGRERVFILPKKEILGEGTSKFVRSGLDFDEEARIGWAKVKSPDAFKEAHKEFHLQQKFGEAYICCSYEIAKSDQAKKKMYIIMPEYNLGSLFSWLEKQGLKALSPSMIKDLSMAICELINKFHSAKVILADCKPENFLLHQEDEHIRVGYNDFGLSYMLKEGDFSPYGGSPAYASPEVVKANRMDASLYEEYQECEHELELYAKGSIQYQETVDEMNDLVVQMKALKQSVGPERDVYTAGLTLSFFFRKKFPFWITPALDWYPDICEYMINPDRYEKVYSEKRAEIQGGNKHPSLDRILFHMTDPDPMKRWRMVHVLQALEKVDWKKDPYLKAS